MPKPPPPGSPAWKVINFFGRLNVLAFRATKGRVGGGFGKAKILVLHHVGRRSGTARTSPLIYLADGRDLVLVASKAGVDQHPAWFHNLMGSPDTEVELPGGERRRVRARVAGDEERERLWPQMVAVYPAYENYQTYTSRRIPVVVLEPTA